MARDITIDKISMVFNTRGEPLIALDKVDLHIPAGCFASIVGPTGCGKSTLLRLIADAAQPFAGKITIGGESPAALRQAHGVGLVGPSPTLLPWRSVLRNIELPLDIAGHGGARQSKTPAKDMIERVGLGGFEEALPLALSDAMQQRVALARALILKPDVLLLDEPFAALDDITRQQMDLELLRIWTGTGTTALLMTHSIAEAVLVSDVVHIMSARPNVVAGSVEVPLQRPRSLATIRTPAFFDCVNQVHDHLFGQESLSGRESQETAPRAQRAQTP